MTKILYVEDNEDNIYMLSRRLKRKGFELVIAKDGAAGVETAKNEKPDLILMDLSLPVLDGWGATRELKKNDSTKEIPVIALSAHAMEEHKVSALEAGCNDYDTKPVDFARLLSKIEEQLSKVSE
ncbi:MAG: two-component system response regulator [Rhodospirillaceae bacterium]|nr:two-component system response regulator [Rhodospirillaceae bacterium]|tara:strand:- start:7335 stop:7709 length:375 start_codon:yes stop_codon:yes gene_type:complete